MIVTFCGHRDIDYNNIILKRLYEVTEKLINAGADEFLLGGYGNFDTLAAKTVNNLKSKYPHIKSILVIPYLERKYDLYMYDDSVYPPLEKVPYKLAILKRNEWMIKKSDVMVSYVRYTWGGTAKMLQCAKKNKIKIINLCDDL